ncbi:MAG TPA: tetratricopeptide repeat protein [Verrucomicrobiae bacterium]|jgi:tetratricopeptide (TPR) repeat protein|nr:tetratricopeptide repeat protein [Verrucomicrobiae bacterium]
MALFGFNKQKVLASAEKYVQQGKLQNAISEYEKILKNDPKDLTVTNTVGDLYSRLGESDKATDCFKNVGDAYASQGFTVKAIAMYKKISKLKPSLESLLKLAELYTQQGLFNDARAQYLQVAEEFLKSNELENAVRIFQKILEMDPENSNMRVRLAEVYVRLGKKNEAWEIFSAAAESMRAKGSLAGADEVLQRMLALDPGNSYALQMQGKNLLETGDAAGAIAAFQKIADLDSKPDALRDVLKAYLMTGQLSEAGTVANKLLTVHNDLAAISSFAEALMQAGQFEIALQVYDQHAERMLAENADKVLQNLHTIIGHVRENPDSLQKLLDLFHKAGETTHVGEVIELLAHASVQAGDLPRARDLYQRLAQLEPQNPLHMQNYQQVVSQLGGATNSKLITPEEAVVLIDDLEATAPSIHQHYSDEVALSVRSALTDAELFISYNMPQKALGPLVAALPLAPNDLRINQRLAALYTRASHFAEAAICCRTLQNLYHEAGYPDEATRYGELSERYEERSSAAEHAAHAAAGMAKGASAEAHEAAEAASSLPEFSLAEAPETGVEEATVDADTSAGAAPWPAASAEAEEITVTPEAELPVAAASSETAAVEDSAAAEIDLSSEWDDAITIEGDESAAEVSTADAAQEELANAAPPSAEEDEFAVAASGADPAKVNETIDEIRFYLSSGMPEQALAGLAKLQIFSNDQATVDQLRAEVEAAMLQAEETASSEPVVEELGSDDIPSAEITVEEESSAPVEAASPSSPAVEVEPAVAAEVATPVAEVAQTESVPAEVEQIEVAASKTAQAVAAKPAVSPEPQPVIAQAQTGASAAHDKDEKKKEETPDTKKGVLSEFVSDLESSLGDNFLPGTVAQPAAAPTIPVAPAAAKTAAAAAQSAPALGQLASEIESSLPTDFLKSAPLAAPPIHAVPPLASAAAAASTVAPNISASHAAIPVPVAAPIATPPVPPAPAAIQEAGVDLAAMFGELKQDLESGSTSSNDEDPETHYNLGIAFREMGLLDEAVGELQKACQAFDRGHPFPNILQTYTWLAHCFLEMNVPEAAVRWYDKALTVPTIDGETRTALHYELGSAYEAAGDKGAALKHFLDVYGSNIDYRDVSERIKALKS